MLIKGGSNYSYEQINQELSEFLAAAYFGGDGGACAVAVVGLRLDSEHEDQCCCTIELKTDLARSKRAEIEATFVARARHAVACKGARPDRVRFAALPRNFKGAVLVKELKAAAWD